MHVLPKKAVQGLRLAIGLTTGNQGGYWIGNLVYCPAGRNVAHFMLAVQRSQADRPVLDAGLGFPNAFTGKGGHVWLLKS